MDGAGNRPSPMREGATISEHKETPQERYHKAHTQSFSIRLMKNTEQDIIEKLNSEPNKAGYVKRLIRADIAANDKKV